MAPLRNKLRGNCVLIDDSRTNFVMTRNFFFWGGGGVLVIVCFALVE